MPKIVLDTNMFISAFVFGGMVETIIDLIIANKLQLYTSPALENEIFKKLREFKVNNKIVTEVSDFLEGSVVVIPADYLITRDKDLLELPGTKWQNTKVIKPEDFLPVLRSLNIANK